MSTFLNSPILYSTILYSIGCCALPIHVFGAYCILFKTPKSMKSVKWALLNVHFWSCLLDLMFCVFIQAFFDSNRHVGMPLGIVRFSKLDVNLVGSTTIVVISLVSVSVVSIFENRFYLLCMQRTAWYYLRYPFLAANYILALSNFIPPVMEVLGDQDQTRQKEYLFQKIPELRNFESLEHPLVLISFENHLMAGRAVALHIIYLAQVLALAFSIHLLMRRAFRKSQISVGANEILKTLNRAIALQVSIPLFIMFLPELIVLVLRLVSDDKDVTNLSGIVVSCHGVCGTILMIYLHKPYRSFCVLVFSGKCCVGRKQGAVGAIVLYFIGCLCLPIHIFGGYCILAQTPSSMKSVKYALFRLHVRSCCLDLYISILAQPFVCTPAFAGFPVGILKTYFGVDTKILIYLLAMNAILVGVATVSVFENRFCTLHGHNTIWKIARIPFLLGNYVVGSAMVTYSLSAIPEQDSARRQLFQMFPEIQLFDSPKSPIFVVFVTNKQLSVEATLFIFLLILEISGFVVMIQMVMVKSMKTMTISANALKCQKSLIRGISLQVSIPLFIMMIPKLITFIIRLCNGPHQEINNFAYFIISTHGACAALCMIYLQKPYREFALRILCPLRANVRKVVVIG